MSVVVKVNGEPITEDKLDKAVTRYIIQLEEDEDSQFKPTKDNLKYTKAEALSALIERELLLQLSNEQENAVSEDMVEKRINDLKNRFENNEEWKSNMTAMRLTEDEFWNEIYEDMKIEVFLDQYYNHHLNFKDEDVKNYFEENEKFMKEPDLFSFYQIFANKREDIKQVALTLDRYPEDEFEKRVKYLDVEVEKHEDLPAYKIPVEILNVLSDLEEKKIGTMEGPSGGVFIFYLIKKRIGRKIEFETVKDQIVDYLIAQGKKQMYSDLINEVQDKADIEYIDTGYIE